MARSYPDLNLQLGAGFNCAANRFISVEIKGFSLHRALGEERFAPAPPSYQFPLPEKPRSGTQRSLSLWFYPGLFMRLFFFLKMVINHPCPLQSVKMRVPKRAARRWGWSCPCDGDGWWSLREGVCWLMSVCPSLSACQDAVVPPCLLPGLEMGLWVLAGTSPEHHPRRAERTLAAHQQLN